jgi:threonine synthase
VTISPDVRTEVRCTNCGRAYPEQGAPYRCPVCNGVFDAPVLPAYDPEQVERRLPGIWRFRHTFGLAEQTPVVSLGEGNTPLLWYRALGKQVGFKLEFLNPTGSYKDRGSALLLSFLRSRGVEQGVEDSSGNAGASYAAYAAAAGVRAQVFVPEYASGPKRKQIEAYGAQVTAVPGPRSQTTEAALQKVTQGAVYASHAYLPYGLAGYATLAYELYEQCGGAPGAVVTPAGQGNLLLAIGRGFQNLKRAGLIEKLPVMVGVQALACAPLWALYRYGAAGLGWVSEGETLAEGVRVRNPVHGDAVMQVILESQGMFVAVDEADILPGREALAKLGLYVEPTSAIVWNALEQVGAELPEPLAVVLTGSGLKSN